MIADGEPGPAMVSFLTEIIGLTFEQVNELRNAPRGYDVLPRAHPVTSLGVGLRPRQPGMQQLRGFGT